MARTLLLGLLSGAVLGALYGLLFSAGIALLPLLSLRPAGWDVAGSGQLHDLVALLYLGVAYGSVFGGGLGVAAGLVSGLSRLLAEHAWPAAERWATPVLAALTVVLLSPRPILQGITPWPFTDLLFLTLAPALVAGAAAYWVAERGVLAPSSPRVAPAPTQPSQ